MEAPRCAAVSPETSFTTSRSSKFRRRGFHTRKGLRQSRETAEIAMRSEQGRQLLDSTKQHEAALKMQAQFQGFASQIDYTQPPSPVRS